MSHIYFHVDLNAFFANAEVLLDSSLKGKPIAVSEETRRSVVSTASYEARKFGVHSAMPIEQAKHLCKELIIVSPHFHYYQALSQQFITILKSYTPLIEQASIDECYMDVTLPICHYAKPLDMAFEIQRRVLKEVGIPCSIGVAPNLFLAKMGSDYKKPMGITIMRIRDVEQKLWPLPIKDMRGVGAKTIPLLEEMGIFTIGDLANYSNHDALKPIFGKNTETIIEKAHGYDYQKMETESDSKSIGVSQTLLEDVSDYDEIRGMIRQLSHKLFQRLKSNEKAGDTISCKIRYYDFTTNERSKKLDHVIFKEDDIFTETMRLFNDNWENEAVRLIGITLSNLYSNESIKQQISLFDPLQQEEERTNALLKELNESIGSTCFVRASQAKKAIHQ